ncbi:peptidase S8 [Streptomyces hygroscopicus subsp. limoneus]|nr:peptidase S8 [Streptomyces hygroscopicus subsp. limoneus]
MPAASKYVTAVGGTSLTTSSNTRGWTDTVWSGAGSGCATYDAKPSWQKDTGCANRTVADVSAVADPNTGVAVYDSYRSATGWMVFGGTSASAPLIAATYALGGAPSSVSSPASFPYAHTSALYDVTSGSDGPTGLGVPNGTTPSPAEQCDGLSRLAVCSTGGPGSPPPVRGASGPPRPGRKSATTVLESESEKHLALFRARRPTPAKSVVPPSSAWSGSLAGGVSV